ncbi:MAG: hypothetical protein ACR2OC_08755 [Solirubrobacterales bacterium]
MAALSRAAALLALVGLGGCSFGTDDPGQTVEDLRDAFASGNVAAACEEIVPDAQQLFYPETELEDGIVTGYANGCVNPQQVELDAEAKTAASGTRVISSEVNGDEAEVVTETGSGEELRMTLVRIDERWRVKAPAELLEGMDADAKLATRRAQTAIEAYMAEAKTYTGADAAELRDIDPQLSGAWLTTASGSGDTYEVGVTSASGTEFTISRGADGAISSTCNDPALGGCAAGGAWSEYAN